MGRSLSYRLPPKFYIKREQYGYKFIYRVTRKKPLDLHHHTTTVVLADSCLSVTGLRIGLRVLEIGVLRKILRPKRDEVTGGCKITHNDLYVRALL
jgi:hypothetical protein